MIYMILFIEYRCSTYFILVCTYISDDIYYTQLIEYVVFVVRICLCPLFGLVYTYHW